MLTNSSVELILRPEDYFEKDGEENCSPGVLDHKEDQGWSFGIMFLKRFLVLYNFKENQLGFARAFVP